MGLQTLGVIQDTEVNCFLKKSKTAGQNYTLHCSRWPAWDQAITSACNFSWVIESIENEMTWETAGQEDSDYCLVLREQELKALGSCLHPDKNGGEAWGDSSLGCARKVWRCCGGDQMLGREAGTAVCIF